MAFAANIERVIEHIDRLRDQVDDHWQIPRDEASVLAQILRISGGYSVCEIGASYGFSTLHFAAVLHERGEYGEGMVHTIDIDPKKVAHTREHIAQAGLEAYVQVHQGDAREVLKTLVPDQPFDFAFIDAMKDQCFEYLEVLRPHLASRAVIVTDNTTTHAQELEAFVAHLRQWPGAQSEHVPVGNGFELTLIER